MSWEPPSFIEINMNAEINSYQNDFAETPEITELAMEVPAVVIPQKD